MSSAQVSGAASNQPPALELRNVQRVFGALRAIDDVSFTVNQGQRYAVLGTNGAGKTTLFNAITGDFLPTSGQILLFGEDITRMPVHKRIRRGLRRTYQSSLLFRELTVWDNLFLSIRGVGKRRFSILRPSTSDPSVHATEKLLNHSGLSKVARKPVKELSHGQQRQLEITMALAGSPKLILLDEPAAGLSPVEREELTKMLRELPSEICFILIEHDLEIALAVVDRVTVMYNGRALCHGTPEEIQNNEQVQAIYMGEHAHV